MKGECINVEGEALRLFRDAVFAKHGRLYGVLRREASEALRDRALKLREAEMAFATALEWYRAEVCRKERHQHGEAGELDCLLQTVAKARAAHAPAAGEA